MAQNNIIILLGADVVEFCVILAACGLLFTSELIGFERRLKCICSFVACLVGRYIFLVKYGTSIIALYFNTFSAKKRQKADDKIYVCKFSKTVLSKLYHMDQR